MDSAVLQTIIIMVAVVTGMQVEIARTYEKNGAACLSILTDEKHFQGSFENLEAVRSSGINVSMTYIHACTRVTCGRSEPFVCLSPDFCTHAFRVRPVIKCMVQCPLLCKEFVIDAWQIYYARSKGADAVLLIAAVLPDIDITYFLRVCKSLGMAALVEVNYLVPTLSPFVLSFFLSFFTHVFHGQLVLYIHPVHANRFVWKQRM